MSALGLANTVVLASLAFGKQQGRQDSINLQQVEWQRQQQERIVREELAHKTVLAAIADLSREVGSLATEVHGYQGQNGMKGEMMEMRKAVRQLENRITNCQFSRLRGPSAPPCGPGDE